uniref:COL n=1 Tax=Rhizophora mucronata TaxID=61149 RepID=A0A2P2QSR4_RHIMU
MHLLVAQQAELRRVGSAVQNRRLLAAEIAGHAIRLAAHHLH